MRLMLVLVAVVALLSVAAQPAGADTKSWCAATIQINTKYGTMKNKRFLPGNTVPLSAWKNVVDAALASRSRYLAITPSAIKTAVTHELAWFAKMKAHNYLRTTPLGPLTVAEVQKIATFEKTQCGISFG